MYTCPVCGYDALKKRPVDHAICPCCGVQFGYNDVGPLSAQEMHATLRKRWIARGAAWQSVTIPKPATWNAWSQLTKAKLMQDEENASDSTESSMGVKVAKTV